MYRYAPRRKSPESSQAWVCKEYLGTVDCPGPAEMVSRYCLRYWIVGRLHGKFKPFLRQIQCNVIASLIIQNFMIKRAISLVDYGCFNFNRLIIFAATLMQAWSVCGHEVFPGCQVLWLIPVHDASCTLINTCSASRTCRGSKRQVLSRQPKDYAWPTHLRRSEVVM